MEKILILDSNSLINRAFYALPLLSNSKGIHTNGIYGYLTMFLKMIEEFDPKYIIATFDRKAKTFRHKEFKDYKAGRKSMPNELAEQLDPLKQILTAMNINIFEMDGFEADDLIGTFSKIYEQHGFETLIVTGDRDALQLASDVTKVIITKKGITEKEVYDKNKMLEIYGVTPEEFIDVKALMGDKSDNIPGVPGIGEKGALNLVKKYKSIENIYTSMDEIKQSKIKDSLIKNMDLCFLSKKLSKINRDVPIDFDEKSLLCFSDYDKKNVYDLFLEYELHSIMSKFGLEDEINNTCVEDLIQLIEIFEVETFETIFNKNSNEIIYLICEIIGDKISNLEFSKIYLSFEEKSYSLSKEFIYNNFKTVVKYLFESEFQKVCINSKDIYKVLLKNSYEFRNNIFDLTLATYLIDPGKGGYEVENIINKYSKVYLNEHNKYLAVGYMDAVYKKLKEEIIKNDMEELYYEIEHPLSLVLAEVEITGFRVCIETLNILRKEFDIKISELSKKIYDLSGEEFNINSTKQLGVILFEKLDLPVIKKTKTGYSTNAEVLEYLEDKHEIIGEIINYRQIAKLQSTYVIGLIDVIDSDDKIHTSFNQMVTTTGRLSSTDPNLQNIPIRQELGRAIRKVFIAENDCLILSADYSQIELRVLAHISKDKNMIYAFSKDLDIHRLTASEIFSVDESEVTDSMRSSCKAVNFGIVYGISDFALSKDLKISRKEAREYMDRYFDRYVGVKKYLGDIIDFSSEKGFVKTIFNRVRNIPEIKSSNRIVKSLGERLAMNTPIQGSAADIIKLAMIKVYNKLKERNLKSSLILQVHDELVLNVYKNELDEVSNIVKEEMESVCTMEVPLKVNISCGLTWFEAK